MLSQPETRSRRHPCRRRRRSRAIRSSRSVISWFAFGRSVGHDGGRYPEKPKRRPKDLPLDAALAESLLKLKLRSPYQQPTDWVFASPEDEGQANRSGQTRCGDATEKPAVKAAEDNENAFAFHTFRHTYTTLLTQNNEDVKVCAGNFFVTRTVGLRSICTRKQEWRGKRGSTAEGRRRMVLKKGKGSGLVGPIWTMRGIADSLQVFEKEWRGRRDSNSRPLP